ncbi:hypothetical protein AEBR_1892 [Halarcobacter ebronensis]|nr:hypothetical protein AEBR_1892 [Halarcobacter ebronensis]
MIKYFTQFFHVLIIAGFLLAATGCGYKAPPTYVDDKQEVSK